MRKQGRLLSDSVSETKTAAGHFAKGYRGKRFGSPGKPLGSVKVERVGKYWGVFDYDPQRGIRYISLAAGKKRGKLLYG